MGRSHRFPIPAALVGGLLLVLGIAPSAAGGKQVQGPGGCVYEVIEYAMVEGASPGVRIGAAVGPNARRSLLLQMTCTRSGQTSYLVPPGVKSYGSDASAGVAVDALSGGLVLVWEHSEARASDIYLAEYDGERWAGPVVLTSDSVDNRDPSFVMDGLGRIHLVWWEDGALGGIRYARIDRENRWSDFSVVGIPVEVSSPEFSGSGTGGSQALLGSRFPFLAYDARADLVYLAFENPSDQSVTVLWFESGTPPDSKGGGQAIVPVVLVKGGPGLDQKRSVAARPVVFSCRDATVVFWWQAPTRIGYVYFLASRPELGPTAVLELEVPGGISQEQAQNVVLGRVYRDLYGSDARVPGGRQASDRGIR